MRARSCSGATLEFIACPLESADNEEKKREEKRSEVKRMMVLFSYGSGTLYQPNSDH
jgi:hypothetical protein